MQSKQAKHSYTWNTIYQIALEHKKALIYSHFIAILATIASVPVPLLMPLLVDEVLLNKPGAGNWHHKPTVSRRMASSHSLYFCYFDCQFNAENYCNHF